MTVSCWRGDNRWEEALYVLKKSTTKPGIPTVIDCQLCSSAGNTKVELQQHQRTRANGPIGSSIEAIAAVSDIHLLFSSCQWQRTEALLGLLQQNVSM